MKGRVEFRVEGLPATFATRGEMGWRALVTAVAERAMARREPLPGRLRVEIDFRLPERATGHPGCDLDNLVKPTIDALGPVIGIRLGNWKHQQPDDERVDEILARKRTVGPGGVGRSGGCGDVRSFSWARRRASP